MIKNFVCFFSLLLIFTNLEAYPVFIKGRVKGFQNGEKIDFFLPVNKQYYNNNIVSEEVTLSNSDDFNLTVDINNPVFIKANIRNVPIFLFATFGDSLNIFIDLDKITAEGGTKDWLIFKGANASGQQYFNNYFFGFNALRKFQPIYNTYEHLLDNKMEMVKRVQDSISTSLMPLYNLKTHNKISELFYNNVEQTLKALLYSEALKPFMRPSNLSNNCTVETLNSIRETFFSTLNPLDSILLSGVLSSAYTHDFLTYLDLKKRHYKTSSDIQDSIIYINSNKKLTINKTFIPYLYMQNLKTQEYLWGDYFLALLKMFPDETFGNDSFAGFCYYHPQSNYIILIGNRISSNPKADSNEYLNKKRSDIIFLDTSQSISSLENLIKTIPNPMGLYVDLWATWCQPCLMEFNENQTLDTFLRQNNIDRLYISIDDSFSKKTWRNYINRFNLTGYNAIANHSLNENIKKKIYSDKENFTIPRYIIIGPNGLLLNKNAFRPSDGMLLINQLKKYLLK